MISDLHSVMSPDDSADFDVVVVGAGPAGISLALELARSPFQIALLEAGGLDDPGAEAFELFSGDNVGLPYALASSRQRFFGGTSNHWGGWCRPLDPYDLEPPDWVALSGWPFDFSELEPWYQAAHPVLEMEDLTYDADGQVAEGELLPAEPASGFVNRLFRFSPPTRFGTVYRPHLAASRNVHVFLHAPVVELLHDRAQVQACRVRGLDGGDYWFRSRIVVLAMGGLEVPRLLLHTATDEADALGNQGGLLGRCFMEHYGYTPGFIMAAPRLRYYRHLGPQADQMPALAPRPELLAREQILNSSALLTAVEPDTHWSPAVLGTPGLLPELGDEAWRYRLTLINESSPYPDSRLSLQSERDILGLRRIRLDWRINPADFNSIETVVRSLSAWLGRLGLGRVQFTRPISPETITQFGTGMHHMGTTRMSASPREGVVDPDCRVHGTENLYVASSSVFPTSGYANPTLTIVALSLRLAAQLKENLG